ncbi:Epidermal growth factor receptor kinase substrate 8-like protein 2 [Oopsacas minuta]|uniref:Epidermal growth factor receptor kinase substrate 8-like protein 2 n=1 Tax=Oopsacas minuta TaxID=111878 RepID=A0AAV7KIZ3_9METZ|nr:Epidermal growth factor receptor kinase substrate 8-like protein 2 [Oopsacas minuta]
MVSRLITNLEKKPLLEDSLGPTCVVLTKKSSKEEVALWLQEEGFLLARDKLKGITGKELYSTSKEEFKRILGFAESARLFSRLLKEKEFLPEQEKTIKESDFQRFMRIRREDVDSRNPTTSLDVPSVPPKPTRPMIREVFFEPEEPVRYVEKVKKPKEKPCDTSASKKTHSKHKEDATKKERRVRESPDTCESDSGDEKRRQRRHKLSKDRKVRDKEEGKVKKDKHKKSHKSKLEKYSDSETNTSSEIESPRTPPRRSKHKNRRKDKDKGKTQAKEKTKEEPEPTSPTPPQQQFQNSLRPQMSPYGPISPMLPPHLPPQYPPTFPDPYTNQLMLQQAQIARAEQDRFAAEMRLRQLKSGFAAPGAMPFPPPMQHFSNF